MNVQVLPSLYPALVSALNKGAESGLGGLKGTASQGRRTCTDSTHCQFPSHATPVMQCSPNRSSYLFTFRAGLFLLSGIQK